MASGSACIAIKHGLFLLLFSAPLGFAAFALARTAAIYVALGIAELTFLMTLLIYWSGIAAARGYGLGTIVTWVYSMSVMLLNVSAISDQDIAGLLVAIIDTCLPLAAVLLFRLCYCSRYENVAFATLMAILFQRVCRHSNQMRLNACEVQAPVGFECSICMAQAAPAVVQLKACKHMFCGACITKWVVTEQHYTCPLCRVYAMEEPDCCASLVVVVAR